MKFRCNVQCQLERALRSYVRGFQEVSVKLSGAKNSRQGTGLEEATRRQMRRLIATTDNDIAALTEKTTV